jgi:hypothetical protein
MLRNSRLHKKDIRSDASFFKFALTPFYKALSKSIHHHLHTLYLISYKCNDMNWLVYNLEEMNMLLALKKIDKKL